MSCICVHQTKKPHYLLQPPSLRGAPSSCTLRPVRTRNLPDSSPGPPGTRTLAQSLSTRSLCLWKAYSSVHGSQPRLRPRRMRLETNPQTSKQSLTKSVLALLPDWMYFTRRHAFFVHCCVWWWCARVPVICGVETCRSNPVITPPRRWATHMLECAPAEPYTCANIFPTFSDTSTHQHGSTQAVFAQNENKKLMYRVGRGAT